MQGDDVGGGAGGWCRVMVQGVVQGVVQSRVTRMWVGRPTNRGLISGRSEIAVLL